MSFSDKTVGFTALESRPVYDRAELEATFLPVGTMLQLDRVLEIDGPRILCELNLAGHWAFYVHFPSDPIFPGSLLLEASGQAAAIWAWHAGLRGKPRLVKVTARYESPVLPNDRTVLLEGTVRQRRNVCLAGVDAFVEKRRVAQFDLTVIIIPGEETGV